MNRLISHVISNVQPRPVKRKLDRFRFFYKGLGKRSTVGAYGDIDQMNNEGDESLILVEHLLNEANTLAKLVPNFQQYIFTKHPDYLSEKIKNLRKLMEKKQTKRAPEMFSENLYPLQSGKQELEATLDQTLNSNEDDFNNNIEGLDHSSVNDESESNTNEVTNEPHNEKMPTKSPFDIYFASPDLEMKNETHDKNKIEGIKDTAKNEQRSKRWWAATMFSKFRSPKSSNRRVSKTFHADPAIYFIGLGR